MSQITKINHHLNVNQTQTRRINYHETVVSTTSSSRDVFSTTGDTGTLLVETKVGDYYQITMKDGNFLDCKRIQKKAYVEWQANYANK